jgi:hypothetical protein
MSGAQRDWLRRPDWQPQLASVIEEWRGRPFNYGAADCLQFAAECVRAMTGVDFRERFPRYETKMQAARIVCEYRDLGGLLTAVLGEWKLPAHAQVGDVVLGDFGQSDTAGVCVGRVLAAQGERGLVFPPMAQASRAWSV